MGTDRVVLLHQEGRSQAVDGWPTVEEVLVDKKAIVFLSLVVGGFVAAVVSICVWFTLNN